MAKRSTRAVEQAQEEGRLRGVARALRRPPPPITRWASHIALVRRKKLPPAPLDLPALAETVRDDLGHYVAWHRYLESFLPRSGSDRLRAVHRTRVSAARRFELAIRRFAKAVTEAEKAGLLDSMRELPPDRTPSAQWVTHWQRVDDLLDGLGVGRLDDLVDLVGQHRRSLCLPKGRPRDRFAYLVAENTAGILLDAGVSCSKVRGGIFDQVLREVFRATQVSVPNDMYPYLRHGVDAARSRISEVANGQTRTQAPSSSALVD